MACSRLHEVHFSVDALVFPWDLEFAGVGEDLVGDHDDDNHDDPVTTGHDEGLGHDDEEMTEHRVAFHSVLGPEDP